MTPSVWAAAKDGAPATWPPPKVKLGVEVKTTSVGTGLPSINCRILYPNRPEMPVLVVGVHWTVITPEGAELTILRYCAGGKGLLTSTWIVPTLSGDGGRAKPL